MKKNKILIFILFIVILSVLVFNIFVKKILNMNVVKNELNSNIEKEIKEHSKHYLLKDKDIIFKIKGPIAIKIFPTNKLIIKNIEIKNILHQGFILNGTIKNLESKLNFKDLIKKHINIDNIIITDSIISIEKINLPESYKKNEKIKELKKLEQDEIVGIKGKLKEILTGKQETEKIKEGYKEVEIEKEVEVKLDNTEIKKMLIKIFSLFKNINKNIDLDLTNKKQINMGIINTNINLINNNSIIKEYKNINGNFEKKNNKFKFKNTFVSSNILSEINGKGTIEDNNIIDIKFYVLNDLKDNLNFDLKLNNDFYKIDNFKDLDCDGKIDGKLNSLNNFFQWLLPVNSKYFGKFDYKKNINFKICLSNNSSGTKITDFSIDSEDFKANATGNFIKNKNNIILNIIDINLNNFIINSENSSVQIDKKDINIFKTNNLKDVLKTMKKEDDNLKINNNLSLNIDKLIYKNNEIKKSKIELEINNGFYKIKNFDLNLNGLKIDITNEENIDGFFVNDLKITGDNIKDILKNLNLENFIGFNKFELNSKLFIYDNVIYLKDFYINDDLQKLSGDIEFSFIRNKKYFASNLKINQVDITNLEFQSTKTVKEKFIWLNNIYNNVFINFDIENIKYKNYKDIKFKGKVNYKNNLINFYDIENLSLDNIKNLAGNFEIGINSSKPFINSNISIDNIELSQIGLLDFFVNVSKYKNIILDENNEEKKEYWVNRFFNIPLWNDVDGNISAKINKIKLNSKDITDINLESDIYDGSFKMKNLSFLGFGGKTMLRGQIDIKDVRSINLILSDTTYNIKDILQILTNSTINDIDGILGIGFKFVAQGFNKNVFLSSISLNSKFIGQNLYIKQFGLNDLKNKLKLSIDDKKILNKLQPKNVILNNTGTLFNTFSGDFNINKNISRLSLEAQSEEYSSKLLGMINNAEQKIIFDFNDISSIILKINNEIVPLYISVNFSENFDNKASLTIDDKQINEYLNLLKESINRNNEQ